MAHPTLRAMGPICKVLTLTVSVQAILLACSPPELLNTHALLVATWRTYERDFISPDGQVRDPTSTTGWFHSEHVIPTRTTSEGQSYAMLRAAWAGDRVEFDRVWHWTRTHLQVRPDRLLSWLWAPDQNDNWSIAGFNSASDADEDVALALILAGHRWHDAEYLSQARAMVDDIWRLEVVRNRDAYYLTPGNWGPSYGPGIVVNPSYLAPYEYRIFATEDPSHPWVRLAESSYRALHDCSWARLEPRHSAGLPPNWCVIDRVHGGAASFTVAEGDDYGYDAFRVMWRVAIDAMWYHSASARRYLEESSYLRVRWAGQGWLAAQYRHDGSLERRPWEDPTIYGGDVGNFVVTDPRAATALLQEKLLAGYHSGGGVAYWGNYRWSSYQQSWAWFGVALATGELPNLATGQ